ncbi:hypothetical protein ACFYPW_03835 [Micromonospora zamorensis]|uniref:hypothetical protein n=1 Tax=Micromonospora zamorensis TaxID=709883 RepID=UPI0036887E66
MLNETVRLLSQENDRIKRGCRTGTPCTSYHDWIWLSDHVLNRPGVATAKREIYVQLASLRPARAPDNTARRAALGARPLAPGQPGGAFSLV